MKSSSQSELPGFVVRFFFVGAQGLFLELVFCELLAESTSFLLSEINGLVLLFLEIFSSLGLPLHVDNSQDLCN